MGVGLFAAGAAEAVVKPSKFDRFWLILNDFKIMDQCLPKQCQVFGRQHGARARWLSHINCSLRGLAELVHGVVFATSFQRGFTGKIFFMIITNIGARHVLMLHTGDALADFLALDASNIAKHAHLAEIILRKIVGAERCRVVRR